jgi:hypothetical protein
MKILTILPIFLIAISLYGFGQTKISGAILDESGNPLPGANVYIENTYDGTSTNPSGGFEFVSNERGKQNIIVDFIGFESTSSEIHLAGNPILLSLKLKEKFNQLDAVNISAGTFEAGDKKKSIALTPIDMVTTPSAAGDIYGAIQALPGTTTVGESGKLYVKGGDSRESKTFIDGTLVYAPYSSSPPNQAVRGRFNPFMFSGTMFSTGGYSAEYGQALSGVLALKTNEVPVEDQLNLSIMSVGVGAAGTKTYEKSSVSASLNYYNLKPYMQLAPQNLNWNAEPESVNGEVSYRLKTAKLGLLKLYTSVSRSNMSLAQANQGATDSHENFNLVNDNVFVNTSWIGELNNNWILSTGLSYTNNIDYVTLDTAKYNEYLKGGHAKAMISKKVTDKIKIKFGTELFSKQFENEFLAPNDSIYNGFESNMATAFAETDIYASEKFVTRIGARFEYSNYLKRFNFSPRISTAYKFSKSRQVSLAYGWFFQDAADEYLLYTNKLDFERADHYTLNYQYEKNQRIIRSELFYKGYSNLVKFTDAPFYTAEGYNNKGNGYAYGFDLFFRDNKTIKNGEYWISYSYIDAEKNYLDFPETSAPKYSSKHNFTLVYKHWIPGMRSQIAASYKYASPRVYNNPNSSIFNGEQTMAYQTFDMSWSYLFCQSIIFYASASNLPGFKQHFGYNYSDTPNDEGVYAATPLVPGAKRFFILGCFITLSRKGDINQLDKIN